MKINRFKKTFTVVFLVFIIFGGSFLFSFVLAADSFLRIEILAVCGNDLQEYGEDCDGADLGGQTCEGLGYREGTLFCRTDCTFDTTNCIAADPRTGSSGTIDRGEKIETKVVFRGRAYPHSPVYLLQDGKRAGVFNADSQANFNIEVKGITPGIYTFGLWARDQRNKKSITYSLAFQVNSNTVTTVSGIYLPPTIDLDKIRVRRGEILNIFGQSVPEAKVNVHIFSSEKIEEAQTDDLGAWLLSFDTLEMENGRHITKAKFVLSGEEESGFSEAISFLVVGGASVDNGAEPEEAKIPADGSFFAEPPYKCLAGDLNDDGYVNLIDFSIMLYWWNRIDECADQNNDGIVNLADFSILLYYWTG